MVVIKANITPGDELQTPHSWKVIAGSSQPPPRKTTIFFDQKGTEMEQLRQNSVLQSEAQSQIYASFLASFSNQKPRMKFTPVLFGFPFS